MKKIKKYVVNPEEVPFVKWELAFDDSGNLRGNFLYHVGLTDFVNGLSEAERKWFSDGWSFIMRSTGEELKRMTLESCLDDLKRGGVSPLVFHKRPGS